MILFRIPRFIRTFFPNRTWRFSSSEKVVYLTFDDGPDSVLTPWILDLLAEKKIQATFFCVGENVLKNPSIFQRIKQEGHSIGNHTMNHSKGSKMKIDLYIQNTERANEFIKSSLFRPPYGRITLKQVKQLKKKYKIVMWTWMANEFNNRINDQTILQKAKKQIQAGDIIVLHDNPKTKNRIQILLPEIITIIQKKGFEFRRIEMT